MVGLLVIKMELSITLRTKDCLDFEKSIPGAHKALVNGEDFLGLQLNKLFNNQYLFSLPALLYACLFMHTILHYHFLYKPSKKVLLFLLLFQASIYLLSFSIRICGNFLKKYKAKAVPVHQ